MPNPSQILNLGAPSKWEILEFKENYAHPRLSLMELKQEALVMLSLEDEILMTKLLIIPLIKWLSWYLSCFGARSMENEWDMTNLDDMF